MSQVHENDSGMSLCSPLLRISETESSKVPNAALSLAPQCWKFFGQRSSVLKTKSNDLRKAPSSLPYVLFLFLRCFIPTYWEVGRQSRGTSKCIRYSITGSAILAKHVASIFKSNR